MGDVDNHRSQRAAMANHLRLPALLLRSARPLSSGLAGALSLAAVGTRSGFSECSVLVGLAMCAVTMFGFVVNDILDFEKDAAAGVARPIAMGSLSRRSALIFAIFLLLVVCGLSAAVGSGRTVLVLTVVALVLYTPFARHLPLLKGLYVAGLALTPLYYASVVSHANFSGAAYALLALFVFGRETLMDAHEVLGDQRAGLRTIAAALGQSDARWLGAGMMFVSMAGLNLVTRGVLGRTSAILSIVSLLCVLFWPRVDDGRRIAFSRLPMLAAAVALVSK
jgi:4-hydroxybenzoate polyprenyltransferase